jgi:hypothetical protein
MEHKIYSILFPKVIFLIFENNQHLMASFSKVEIDIPLSSISVRGVFFTPFISSP